MESKEIVIEPGAARAAYDATLPRAEALSLDERAPMTVDVQDAVIVALGVAQFIDQPDVRARFALLPPEVFAGAHIDDLPVLALAAHHGYVALQVARAGGSTAMLGADLVAEAGEVRTRMLELCEYVFRRDPVLSTEVSAIRTGTGYKDAAIDLVRLASIYEAQAEIVARDTINYRATDADDARRLSQTILHQLSQGQDANERYHLSVLTGIWTLLLRCYDEVQAAGSFLYRNEDAASRFRSLFTRSARRSRPAPEAPSVPAPPASAPPASDPDAA
jgi:hypothetical protein